MKISKQVAVLFGILGLAAGTAGTIALETHAAGLSTTANTTATTTNTSSHKQGNPPAASGTVTAISGNTITITNKRSNTSYTVDASNATIQKFTAPVSGSTGSGTKPTPTTISVSGIAVGDNITVQGTVSGTNVVATKITDGMGMMGGRGGFAGGNHQGATGTVSAINGNTITLTGKDGKTYTVDASSASVKKVADSSVSNIAVGDTLMVNGTTSGTSITAKNITDGVLGNPQSSTPVTSSSNN